MLAGITHLRDLNPHIVSIMAAQAHNLDVEGLSALRGCASSVGLASAAVQGVSAFAFQGTNAHAVLQVTSYEASAELTCQVVYYTTLR